MKRWLARLCYRLERPRGAPAEPNFCCFGITDECMLHCAMCRKWEQDRAGGGARPSTEDWKRAVDGVATLTREGFVINFGGGEPLLRGDILEVIAHASSKRLSTNLATNAFLIDRETAKRIGASGLTTINISLDSMDPARHDAIRGREGVFNRAMEAVALLDQFAPKVKKGICCVISALNLGDILALAESVQGDTRLEWLYFMAVVQPNNVPADEHWYRKDFAALWPDPARAGEVISRLIGMKRAGYKIVNRQDQLEAFAKYFRDPGRFVKLSACNLERALHVSAAGDVYICFNGSRLGSIIGGDIAALWRSPAGEAARKEASGCRKNCHFLLNCFFEGDFPFIFS